MAFIKQNQRQCERRVIQPLVNIHQEDKEIILEAEIPGLNKEDIELEVKGNELILRGKTDKSDNNIPKGYTVIHRERCPFDYARTFIIGDDIDKGKIEAKYENGILTVRLARLEEAQPKKIEIKE